MSRADEIFVQNMKDILENGFSDKDLPVRPRWEDGTPAHTIKKFGIVNTYDLQEELPILTIRRTAFKSCLDELLWIWEGEFDQVDRVLYDLKHNPQSRRIMTNIYNFEDLHEMNLYPCAYSMTFNVTGDTLNAILNQRSNDMLTANNWNVLQYALLVMMFAQVSGLKPGKLIHVIADAHIYDRHVDLVKEVIAKPQHPAPKLKMNPNITNFYDFKVEDFELIDYEYEKLDKKIPVAV